jgi:Tfp pilus assembly protein PilF
MKFINSLTQSRKISFTYCLTVLLILLISACSSSPEKKSKKSGENEDQVMGAPGVSILPPGPATPNPYLQNPVNVSKAVASQFAAAQNAMRNQQWSQAEKLLLQIISDNDKLSGAHLNLANIYAAQKEKDKAETSYEMAIFANPNNIDAYNQFGIFKREQGDFVGAENLYKKAIGVWPFHAASHKNLAILYDLYLGKPAQALPHYEAYLQLVGEDKQAASWIADLQRRLGIQPKPKSAPVAETTEVVEETNTETTPEETTEETNTEVISTEDEVTE